MEAANSHKHPCLNKSINQQIINDTSQFLHLAPHCCHLGFLGLPSLFMQKYTAEF